MAKKPSVLAVTMAFSVYRVRYNKAYSMFAESNPTRYKLEVMQALDKLKLELTQLGLNPNQFDWSEEANT